MLQIARRVPLYSRWLALPLTAALTLAVLSRPACAGDVPPSADAGRQDRVLSPRSLTGVAPSTEALQSDAPVLPPEIAAAQFVLHSVTFEGATAFPLPELQALFADLIEERITVAELFSRMARVQQKYLDAGYVLSRVDIPQQDVTGGHVVLRITEGYAERVEIDQALAQSPLVRSVARSIGAMRPLNTKKLERLLLVLSTRPGREATAVLAPADTASAAPGAVIVILRPRTEAEKTSGFVTVDNHGSNYLGPWRGSAGVRQGALFGSDIDAGLGASVSLPMQELQQLTADMSLPLWGASGAVADFSAGQTDTEPGDDLDRVDVRGRARFVRAGISYPVLLQRDRQCTVGASFEYKNVTTDLLAARIFDDRLRVLTVEADYAFADRWYGSTRMNVSVAKGFDILGERSDGVTNISRADGKSDFRKATAGVSRVQALPGGFEAMVAVQGQYAWDPLLSAEEFGYGGAELGRAYDASEIVGDHGVSAMAEIRYATSLPRTEIPAQPYAFYDIGRVWNIDPSAKDKISAASAGVGLRLQFPPSVLMDASMAIPLTKKADNPQTFSEDAGPRFLLSLKKQF